jgi:hypothetical protein
MPHIGARITEKVLAARNQNSELCQPLLQSIEQLVQERVFFPRECTSRTPAPMGQLSAIELAVYKPNALP